ncbi:hypothetical protein M409DRAFT_37300 [Zasmidium cellare ATCC 36951]|uniref:NAD-dependent epimerase/dehydratase domain-containing protein n=1 Tax=Zasmidium cellare ATCC 36951 TaxID=1080233 RepID=A0A6A6C865_ZASCE|nr:uncharacterized protein M409DRAFT_37300 [Zasmidium cellare ATCC 36951]KAF2163033.1 hypothetical protein M409DRAFT_37300 [Zasmidium cellare ATCC 36951]
MKVFITGAAGFVGRAVTTELISHGHTVVGLCRSETSASTVKALGAEIHWGDIEDLPSLTRALAPEHKVDGVVHLAFTMDFSDFPRACSIDRTAIQTMAEALKGSGKPLVMTSGTLLLPDRADGVDEATEVDREGFLAVRAQSEDLIKNLSSELGVRGCVVRLAPVVHGEEDKGFVPMLGDLARKNGFVAYLNSGGPYRWPAVHRRDAAALFRLVLEKGKPGKVYHGVAEEGVDLKGLMEGIGKRMGLPLEGKSQEEIGRLLGFFAGLVGRDNFVRSTKTREELGWMAGREGLLEDIERNYFQ